MDENRLVDALESVAAELERLRLLKEHELGVTVEYWRGDPYVAESETPPEEPTEE